MILKNQNEIIEKKKVEKIKTNIPKTQWVDKTEGER
jgi:hypothetical protein